MFSIPKINNILDKLEITNDSDLISELRDELFDYTSFSIDLTKINLNHKNQLLFLGECYQRGIGIDQDLNKAIEIFKTIDNSMAMYRLGKIYLDKNDNIEAFNYLIKSMDLETDDDNYDIVMMNLPIIKDENIITNLLKQVKTDRVKEYLTEIKN